MAGEPNATGQLPEGISNSTAGSAGGLGLPALATAKVPAVAALQNSAFDIGSPMAAAVAPTAFNADLMDLMGHKASTGSFSPSTAAGELATISLDEDADTPEAGAAAAKPAVEPSTNPAPGSLPAVAAPAPVAATSTPPLHTSAPAAAGAAAAAVAAGSAAQSPSPAPTHPAPTAADPLLMPAAAVLDELPIPAAALPGSMKIYIRDPEKVDLMTMGVVYSHYYTYMVHTDFSPQQPTPAPPTAGASKALGSAAAGHSDSPAATPTAAGEPRGAAATLASSNGNGVDSPMSTASAGALSTSSQPPAAGPHSVEVRRRFSDFEALHRLLKAQYPGYFVPPLPDKSFFDSRFARDNFIKVRQVDLQACMRAIASHPILAGSEELRMFLGYPQDLAHCARWQQLLSDSAGTMEILLHRLAGTSDAAQGAAGGGSSSSGRSSPTSHSGGPAAADGGKRGGPALLLRMKHSLMGAVAPKAKPRHEVSDTELELRQAKELLKELQGQLAAACTSARSLVQHMEATCEDWGDLARGATAMARWDEASAQRLGQYTPAGQDSNARAADLQTTAYAQKKTHDVWKQFSLRSAAALVYLHDYSVLVPEAIATLEQREQVLAGVHMLTDELREKHAALEKLASSSGGAAAPAGSAAAVAQERKIQQLQVQVVQLQDQLVDARQHYQRLCERNKAELVRLNLERRKDFHAAMVTFANVQVQLYNAAAEVWVTASQQLAVSPAAAL